MNETIFKFLESIQSKELGSRTMRRHSPRGTTGNLYNPVENSNTGTKQALL